MSGEVCEGGGVGVVVVAAATSTSMFGWRVVAVVLRSFRLTGWTNERAVITHQSFRGPCGRFSCTTSLSSSIALDVMVEKLYNAMD